jgi:hypothetical protein
VTWNVLVASSVTTPAEVVPSPQSIVAVKPLGSAV